MRRQFVVTFEPTPGSDGICGLHALLKYAGRYLGLRAIDAREQAPTQNTRASPRCGKGGAARFAAPR